MVIQVIGIEHGVITTMAFTSIAAGGMGCEATVFTGI